MAAADPRVSALYDLGGPIDCRLFYRLPYFLKSKFCQVLGVDDWDEAPDYEAHFCVDKTELLDKVRCPVRIVHGAKDPLVPVSDKQWLRQTLRFLHPEQDVSMMVFPTGDHCCTGQAAEIRQDAAAFFVRIFLSAGGRRNRQRDKRLFRRPKSARQVCESGFRLPLFSLI